MILHYNNTNNNLKVETLFNILQVVNHKYLRMVIITIILLINHNLLFNLGNFNNSNSSNNNNSNLINNIKIKIKYNKYNNLNSCLW